MLPSYISIKNLEPLVLCSRDTQQQRQRGDSQTGE